MGRVGLGAVDGNGGGASGRGAIFVQAAARLQCRARRAGPAPVSRTDFECNPPPVRPAASLQCAPAPAAVGRRAAPPRRRKRERPL
jgi:hypothetical protein